MSIRQATRVAVDPGAYSNLAVQSGPKVKNRDTGELKTDRDTGFTMWAIDCLRTEKEGGLVTTVSVSVPSREEPQVNGKQVEFTNLIAMQWAMETGSGLAFRADSVEAISTRSTGKAQS